MCGILAYAGTKISEATLNTSFALVQARGPDYSSLAQVGANARLGFHRLAIMDPLFMAALCREHEGP